MIVRLLKGLAIGLALGGGVGAALFFGAGIWQMGPLVAYGVAAALGVLTGLFAGKPIWSTDGKIEAGLKAVAGALVAAGFMFAARRWVQVDVPNALVPPGLFNATHPLSPHWASISQAPLVVLPAIATALALFFELDNTPAPPGAHAQSQARIASRSGAPASFDEEESDDEAASEQAKRKR
jgi:hypothetical protein